MSESVSSSQSKDDDRTHLKSSFHSSLRPYYDSNCAATSDRDSLFAEFAPLIRRLLRLYAATDPEFRDDLKGELYCRFATYYDEWDQSRGIPRRPYLVCKLNAAAYTFARKRWREQKRETSLEVADEKSLPVTSFDPTLQWNDQLELEQYVQSLPNAIVRLPERQRKVLVWRYYGERSFEDIADDLSIKPATARSLLRHGINNIRKQFMVG